MFQGLPGSVNQQASPLTAGWKLLDFGVSTAAFFESLPKLAMQAA
jgi:hypothetical protein